MAEKKNISRRSLITAAAAGGAAAAVAAPLSALASDATNTAGAEDSAAAGSNADWLGEPPAVTEADCTKTYEADVIVIGAALAGEMACYSAIQNGSTVIAIDRNGSAHVGGSGIGFINSKYQLDAGQPRQDPYEIIQRLYNSFDVRPDIRFIAQWAFYSGAVLDDLEANVLQAAGVPGTASVATVEYVHKERELSQNLNSHVDFDPNGNDSLEAFNNAMHAWIEDHGGRIDYEITARKLTQAEDGTVTGVIAQDFDGNYVYYKASQGVIVCTGSYGHNPEMMRHFAPEWLANYAEKYGIYNGRVSETSPLTTDETIDDGLGHKMMCWCGAVMEENDPSFQSWEDSGYWWWPFLHVTIHGERFRNEEASWLSHTRTIVERPEGVNYYWQIRSANDADMPCTLTPGMAASVFDEMVASTSEVYTADTIEELAEKIGADPDTLVATVERYNELCEQGFDQDYGKLPKYLFAVNEPPYTAIKATCHFYCTSSGVKCNDKLNVLDKDWQPIPHLFAAGNNVGWRMGAGYQMTIPGLCNGFALFHGYLAGRFASDPDFQLDSIGE